MRSSRKFYINQLLNEHDSSYLSSQNPEKNHQRTQVSVELGNLMAKNRGSDVDKGSYPRLLTLTDGSRHTAGSHQPVLNGAPLK
jgi:hypothetical protein